MSKKLKISKAEKLDLEKDEISGYKEFLLDVERGHAVQFHPEQRLFALSEKGRAEVKKQAADGENEPKK